MEFRSFFKLKVTIDLLDFMKNEILIKKYIRTPPYTSIINYHFFFYLKKKKSTLPRA